MKPTADVIIAMTGTKLSAPVVESIIDDAALIAEPCLRGVDGARATAAVKWLAAHLVASTSDQGAGVLTQKSLGDASKSWARGQLGDGLMATTYGQQAVALVPCLARTGRARARIEPL